MWCTSYTRPYRYFIYFQTAPTRKDELYAVSSANFKVDDSAYEPKLMFIIVAPFYDAYSTPSAIFVELPCPVD